MTTTTTSHDVWSTPLTPLAFLGRAAEVFADRDAVVYGERRVTYAQLSDAGDACRSRVAGLWRRRR
jgi:non-ribosomal peptide synthetase component E (peptide arylation enzyme)